MLSINGEAHVATTFILRSTVCGYLRPHCVYMDLETAAPSQIRNKGDHNPFRAPELEALSPIIFHCTATATEMTNSYGFHLLNFRMIYYKIIDIFTMVYIYIHTFITHTI